VSRVGDETRPEGPVSAYPEYAQRRSDYTEPLLPLCTTLLLREGKKADLELSVCAACVRDETWDRSILHDTAPQQLQLYCGSLSLTDFTLGDRGAGGGAGAGAGAGGGGGWVGDRGAGGGLSEWGMTGDFRPHFPLPMHPVLNLGSSVSCCTFQGPHCCVVSPGRTLLVDLGSACSKAKITEILNEAVDTEEEGMVEEKVEKGREKYGVKGGDKDGSGKERGSGKGSEKEKEKDAGPVAESMPIRDKLLVNDLIYVSPNFIIMHLIPLRVSNQTVVSTFNIPYPYPNTICICINCLLSQHVYLSTETIANSRYCVPSPHLPFPPLVPLGSLCDGIRGPGSLL
jgi:hypothetical protein